MPPHGDERAGAAYCQDLEQALNVAGEREAPDLCLSEMER